MIIPMESTKTPKRIIKKQLKNVNKAINDLNLKIETESELMAYCDFFKNVADTK